jgi:hypothetical protein
MKKLIALIALSVATATFAAEPAKKEEGLKHADKKTQDKAEANAEKKVEAKKEKDAAKAATKSQAPTTKDAKATAPATK